jgi:uncharacterized protein with HEPN domain
MLRFTREVVEIFTPGIDRDAYLRDIQLRRSVERSVQLIGEAAKHVSSAFREAHPEIPWRKIIAQRNVLVHEYSDLVDELIWNLVERELPLLIGNLEKALATY